MIRIPVHLLTGFLGAGKTSFLNNFVKSRLPERIFVIENECGAVNVDGALVIDDVKEVVELSAGCLCCSLADGLLQILDEASKRSDHFDRMVIETTDIADPGSIIQVFMENPAIEKEFELKQVVCLVDAGQVREWLNETKEALPQIALADVLLCNKTDTVSANELEDVQLLLKKINPNAKVYSGKNGIFPIEEVMESGTMNAASIEAIANNDHLPYEYKVGNKDRHKITTFTLDFPYPLGLNQMQADLNQIVRQYRSQLYRVKGFIAMPDYPNRVILQSARSVLIASDGSPWEVGHKREGKLVFIGKGLKKETFENMFNHHLVMQDG